MVMSKDEEIELLNLKQKQKLEIMAEQDKQRKQEHLEKVERLNLLLKIAEKGSKGMENY